ncbi:nucleolus and neural progenitor protein isoform X2 [Trichomycterus rosablanca]
MKLQEALQGLQELCPNNIQRNVGVDVGHCSVPSQPMLEWFSLKLLGASSLLSRTLDHCSKAFLLTRQHLCLSEFIVLNLVLVSMLSRLWVFYRGILTALIPLYQSIINLLRDVVPCHSMALPVDMAMFLGRGYSDLLMSQQEFTGIKEVTKLSLLDRLFKKEVDEDFEKAEKKGPSLILDIKSRLQQVQGVTKPSTAEGFVKAASSPELGASNLNIVEKMGKFLTQPKTASSLGDMKEHLKEMMAWCRRCKLHQEHGWLAFTFLRCQKIQAVDCEGVSVQKRLRRLCLRLHRLLLIRKSLPRPSPSLQWKSKCFLRTRFPTLMARYGSIRSRFGLVRMCCKVSGELYDERTKSSKKCKKSKKDIGVLSLHTEMSKSGGVFSKKENKIEKQPSNMNNDEIDDIFSSIV